MVCHLPFIGDTIPFLKEEENTWNVRIFLKILETIFGLKVNMAKSCMAEILVEEHNMIALANVIGYKL